MEEHTNFIGLNSSQIIEILRTMLTKSDMEKRKIKMKNRKLRKEIKKLKVQNIQMRDDLDIIQSKPFIGFGT